MAAQTQAPNQWGTSAAQQGQALINQQRAGGTGRTSLASLYQLGQQPNTFTGFQQNPSAGGVVAPGQAAGAQQPGNLANDVIMRSGQSWGSAVGTPQTPTPSAAAGGAGQPVQGASQVDYAPGYTGAPWTMPAGTGAYGGNPTAPLPAYAAAQAGQNPAPVPSTAAGSPNTLASLYQLGQQAGTGTAASAGYPPGWSPNANGVWQPPGPSQDPAAASAAAAGKPLPYEAPRPALAGGPGNVGLTMQQYMAALASNPGNAYTVPTGLGGTGPATPGGQVPGANQITLATGGVPGQGGSYTGGMFRTLDGQWSLLASDQSKQSPTQGYGLPYYYEATGSPGGGH